MTFADEVNFQFRIYFTQMPEMSGQTTSKVQGKLSRNLSVNWRGNMLKASVLNYILERLRYLQRLQALWGHLSCWECQVWENRELVAKNKRGYDKQDPSMNVYVWLLQDGYQITSLLLLMSEGCRLTCLWEWTHSTLKWTHLTWRSCSL